MLLSVSWPTYGVPFFIFFALVPLLMMEHGISKFSDYKRKAGSFSDFLTCVLDLEYCDYRMVVRFKKPGWKPFYDGRCLSGFGYSLLYSLVFQCYHWYKNAQGTYWGLAFL
jgi:apolipoprotein N-acyltransferase